MLVHSILRVPLGSRAPPRSTRVCVCVRARAHTHTHARTHIFLKTRARYSGNLSHYPAVSSNHHTSCSSNRLNPSWRVCKPELPGQPLCPPWPQLLLFAEHSLCSDSAFLGFIPGCCAVEPCFTQQQSKAWRSLESWQKALRVWYQSWASKQG